MKNVIRKITTWMLVFGMTFTPVMTSIDLVAVNAEAEGGQTTITVDDAIEQVEKAVPMASSNDQDNPPGAQQLIQTAQDNLNAPLVDGDGNNIPATGQPLLDPTKPVDENAKTNLSGDLQNAQKAISGEDGTNQNLQDADSALGDAKAADELAVAYVSYVQAVDADGALLFNADGTPVWEVETDEDGNVVYEVDENGEIKNDADGNAIPVYKKLVISILPTFDTVAGQTETDANNAIGLAGTANKNNDANAANAARTALNNAESGLSNAKGERDAAQEAVNAAAAQAAAADLKAQEATQRVKDAEKALNDALVQEKDENGNLLFEKDENGEYKLDEDGNKIPVYKGNVEEAEEALVQAVADARKLAAEAKTAKETFEATADAAIQEKYGELLAEKASIGDQWNPNKLDDQIHGNYKKLARELVHLVLTKYIGAENIVNYGEDFVIENLISGYNWTNVDENGDPKPERIKDENGEWVKDANGELDAFFYVYETVYGGELGRVFEPIEGNEGWILGENANTHRVAVRVKRKDADGNVVYGEDGEPIVDTKFFNYKANADGSIYVFERTYYIDDNGDVILNPITPVSKEVEDPDQPAVPESWKDASGNELDETKSTTHKVPISENKEDGYYGIDTETSEVLDTDNSKALNVNTVTQGNKTISYEAKGDAEKTYAYGKKQVASGEYYKKTVELPETKKNFDSLNESNIEQMVAQYREDHPGARLYYHHFLGDDELIEGNDPGWYKEWHSGLKAIFEYMDFFDLFDFSSFYFVDTDEVDDLDNPKMVEANGIWETVTQTYTETTTIVEKDDLYNHEIRNQDRKTQEKANDDIQALINQWSRKGYEILSSGVRQHQHSSQDYYAYIKLGKKTKSTSKDVTSVIKTLFAADTYDNYTAAKEAGKKVVPETVGQYGLKTQKVVWNADKPILGGYIDTVNGKLDKDFYAGEDNSNYNAYLARKAELEAQQAKLDQAVLDAEAALNRVQELKKRLADRKSIQLASLAAVEQLNGQLSEAEDALTAANQKVEDLEKLVERARRAVAGIRLSSGEEDESTSGTPGTPGTPAPGTPATSGPVLIPLTGGTTGGRTGVAGVRTPATGEGTGEGTAPADNTVAKNNISTLEETELPGAAEAPSTNLKDTDLPGAQGATEDGMNLWWLWAAIALAIAIGFGIYKYADNKKKAENTIQK